MQVHSGPHGWSSNALPYVMYCVLSKPFSLLVKLTVHTINLGIIQTLNWNFSTWVYYVLQFIKLAGNHSHCFEDKRKDLSERANSEEMLRNIKKQSGKPILLY